MKYIVDSLPTPALPHGVTVRIEATIPRVVLSAVSGWPYGVTVRIEATDFVKSTPWSLSRPGAEVQNRIRSDSPVAFLSRSLAPLRGGDEPLELERGDEVLVLTLDPEVSEAKSTGDVTYTLLTLGE